MLHGSDGHRDAPLAYVEPAGDRGAARNAQGGSRAGDLGAPSGRERKVPALDPGDRDRPHESGRDHGDGAAGGEADLGYSLGDREQFVIAMFRPSTRNLFDEIAEDARSGGWCTLTDAELRELAHLHEAAGALAWIGDAALKIGLLPAIWDQEIANAGNLTKNRKAYDRNSNLALLCDRWNLYEHRIHFDAEIPRSARTINHAKGTLVESVFGILFLREGLKGVASATELLKPSPPRRR